MEGVKFKSQYDFYGEKIIKDDSSLASFAKGCFDYLDISYDGEKDYDDFKDETMEYVMKMVREDLYRTDIDYEDLMYRYRSEIGNILYEMENRGYEYLTTKISFFGEEAAQESFEMLLYFYIDMNFDQIMIKRLDYNLLMAFHSWNCSNRPEANDDLNDTNRKVIRAFKNISGNPIGYKFSEGFVELKDDELYNFCADFILEGTADNIQKVEEAVNTGDVIKVSNTLYELNGLRLIWS